MIQNTSLSHKIPKAFSWLTGLDGPCKTNLIFILEFIAPLFECASLAYVSSFNFVLYMIFKTLSSYKQGLMTVFKSFDTSRLSYQKGC